MIEDELEELANRCTKKKMGLRDSVLTISPGSKNIPQKSYMTRSKGKTMCEENDSS